MGVVDVGTFRKTTLQQWLQLVGEIFNIDGYYNKKIKIKNNYFNLQYIALLVISISLLKIVCILLQDSGTSYIKNY